MEYETRKQIDERVIELYSYGSRVYKSSNKNSDYDYIAIVESENESLVYSVEKHNINITVYSEAKFIEKIKQHEISVLECIFQRLDDKYREQYFELHLPSLRRAVSSVASNSFGKAGKKLKQGDIYIGKKSLSHSLRILEFGIQIGLFGKIVDYTVANQRHKKIIDNKSEDWIEYKNLYQREYNKLKTILKIVAPLEGEN